VKEIRPCKKSYSGSKRYAPNMNRSFMNIDGVVSVSIGTDKSGKPVLKIGTSVPPEQVRARLPQQLLEAGAELEFVGDIRAQ